MAKSVSFRNYSKMDKIIVPTLLGCVSFFIALSAIQYNNHKKMNALASLSGATISSVLFVKATYRARRKARYRQYKEADR